MLDWLYDKFGFWLTFLLLMGIFISIIFWLAGIAGLMLLPDSTSKKIKLLIGIVFPPYTVAWMIFDMFSQKRELRE